jgi:hypothetical protein
MQKAPYKQGYIRDLITTGRLDEAQAACTANVVWHTFRASEYRSLYDRVQFKKRIAAARSKA